MCPSSSGKTIIIALTDHRRLHALANARGRGTALPQAFLEQVKQAVLAIRVSHRPRRKAKGELHQAYFYGATSKPRPAHTEETHRGWAKEWVEDIQKVVRRRLITELTSTKHLDKVRDKTIRSILKQHLRNQQIDPDTSRPIPKEAFTGDNQPKMASGVPIKKVRMIEPGKAMRPASENRRDYQLVKPSNNHHITYWATKHGVWSAEVVPTWDAAKRIQANESPVNRSSRAGKQFVMSLSIGEMFEVDGEDGERLLCVVRKMRGDDARIFYKLHHDARPAKDVEADNLALTSSAMVRRHARKVWVDPLGRQRRAGD